MSWSFVIPKQSDLDAFEYAVNSAKESPKADGRTKVGKAQAEQVEAAKVALVELAGASGATAGNASGHVSPDLSGIISVKVEIAAP